MIQELIFTSARRGLQLGKSGFCTVASTAGMAENVARLLESLSGYRHLFPPGTPEAAANPVNFSHLISRVGGKDLHIFSRVADAGLDYSGRSNKLAHHIACDSSELPPGGPAALLRSQPFETRWDREAERLPPRKLAGGSVAPGICATWERVTGDAGWGGALAEAGHKKRPAVVIVGPGAPSLELVLEALALLPENVQEQVTFSTFYTNLPANVQCLWRFVLADSPEAAAAKRNPQNLVIDCTAKLGVCPSPAADEARQGRRYAPKVSIAPPVPGKPVADAPLELADGDAHELSPSLSGEESAKSAPPPAPYRMAGEPAASAPPELAPPPRGPARFGTGQSSRRSSRRNDSEGDRPNQINTWGIVMLVVGILMTLGGLGAMLLYFAPNFPSSAISPLEIPNGNEQPAATTIDQAQGRVKNGLAEKAGAANHDVGVPQVVATAVDSKPNTLLKAATSQVVTSFSGVTETSCHAIAGGVKYQTTQFAAGLAAASSQLSEITRLLEAVKATWVDVLSIDKLASIFNARGDAVYPIHGWPQEIADESIRLQLDSRLAGFEVQEISSNPKIWKIKRADLEVCDVLLTSMSEQCKEERGVIFRLSASLSPALQADVLRTLEGKALSLGTVQIHPLQVRIVKIPFPEQSNSAAVLGMLNFLKVDLFSEGYTGAVVPKVLDDFEKKVTSVEINHEIIGDFALPQEPGLLHGFEIGLDYKKRSGGSLGLILKITQGQWEFIRGMELSVQKKADSEVNKFEWKLEADPQELDFSDLQLALEFRRKNVLKKFIDQNERIYIPVKERWAAIVDRTLQKDVDSRDSYEDRLKERFTWYTFNRKMLNLAESALAEQGSICEFLLAVDERDNGRQMLPSYEQLQKKKTENQFERSQMMSISSQYSLVNKYLSRAVVPLRVEFEDGSVGHVFVSADGREGFEFSRFPAFLKKGLYWEWFSRK